MSQDTLRAFLAASAVATLGVLGTGSAAGQQGKKEPAGQLLRQFNFSTLLRRCTDRANPTRPQGYCYIHPRYLPVDKGGDGECDCGSRIQQIQASQSGIKIELQDGIKIDIQGLTSEQTKAIIDQLNKEGAPSKETK